MNSFMVTIPAVIVTVDFNNVNVTFDQDLPKIVQFHLKCILFDKFGNMVINRHVLESISSVIAHELKILIAIGQLYYFKGQWKEANLFNYNSLNFQ